MATQCAKQQGQPLARLELATPCTPSFDWSTTKQKNVFQLLVGQLMEGATRKKGNGGQFGSSVPCGIWRKKNTYKQLVDNVVRKWHAVSPYKVKINMNETLVWQMADDGYPTTEGDVTSQFLPQGVHPQLFCNIEK